MTALEDLQRLNSLFAPARRARERRESEKSRVKGQGALYDSLGVPRPPVPLSPAQSRSYIQSMRAKREAEEAEREEAERQKGQGALYDSLGVPRPPVPLSPAQSRSYIQSMRAKREAEEAEREEAERQKGQGALYDSLGVPRPPVPLSPAQSRSYIQSMRAKREAEEADRVEAERQKGQGALYDSLGVPRPPVPLSPAQSQSYLQFMQAKRKAEEAEREEAERQRVLGGVSKSLGHTDYQRGIFTKAPTHLQDDLAATYKARNAAHHALTRKGFELPDTGSRAGLAPIEAAFKSATNLVSQNSATNEVVEWVLHLAAEGEWAADPDNKAKKVPFDLPPLPMTISNLHKGIIHGKKIGDAKVRQTINAINYNDKGEREAALTRLKKGYDDYREGQAALALVDAEVRKFSQPPSAPTEAAVDAAPQPPFAPPTDEGFPPPPSLPAAPQPPFAPPTDEGFPPPPSLPAAPQPPFAPPTDEGFPPPPSLPASAIDPVAAAETPSTEHGYLTRAGEHLDDLASNLGGQVSEDPAGAGGNFFSALSSSVADSIDAIGSPFGALSDKFGAGKLPDFLGGGHVAEAPFKALSWPFGEHGLAGFIDDSDLDHENTSSKLGGLAGLLTGIGAIGKGVKASETLAKAAPGVPAAVLGGVFGEGARDNPPDGESPTSAHYLTNYLSGATLHPLFKAAGVVPNRAARTAAGAVGGGGAFDASTRLDNIFRPPEQHGDPAKSAVEGGFLGLLAGLSKGPGRPPVEAESPRPRYEDPPPRPSVVPEEPPARSARAPEGEAQPSTPAAQPSPAAAREPARAETDAKKAFDGGIKDPANVETIDMQQMLGEVAPIWQVMRDMAKAEMIDRDFDVTPALREVFDVMKATEGDVARVEARAEKDGISETAQDLLDVFYETRDGVISDYRNQDVVKEMLGLYAKKAIASNKRQPNLPEIPKQTPEEVLSEIRTKAEFSEPANPRKPSEGDGGAAAAAKRLDEAIKESDKLKASGKDRVKGKMGKQKLTPEEITKVIREADRPRELREDDLIDSDFDAERGLINLGGMADAAGELAARARFFFSQPGNADKPIPQRYRSAAFNNAPWLVNDLSRMLDFGIARGEGNKSTWKEKERLRRIPVSFTVDQRNRKIMQTAAVEIYRKLGEGRDLPVNSDGTPVKPGVILKHMQDVLFDPATANRNADTAIGKWADAAMKANPKLAKQTRKFYRMFHRWMGKTAGDKAGSKVSEMTPYQKRIHAPASVLAYGRQEGGMHRVFTNTILNSWAKIYDENPKIFTAYKEAIRTQTHTQGVLNYGVPVLAKRQAGYRGFEYVKGRQGLQTILGEVANKGFLKDYVLWRVGMRAEGLHKKGKEKNLSPEDIKALIGKAGENKELFRKTAKAEDVFWRQMLELYEESGLLKKGGAEDIYKNNPDYIHFLRADVMNSNPLSPLSGRSQRLRSPLQAVMEHLHTATNAVRMNLLKQDLHNIARETGGGRFIAETEPSHARQKVLDAVNAALEALPAEAKTGIRQVDMLQAFERALREANMGGRDYSMAFVDGKAEVYQITDPAYMRAVASLSFPARSAFAEGFNKTRIVTTKGTVLSPRFWFRQLVRDPIFVSIMSEHGVNPRHFAQSAKELTMDRGEHLAEYKQQVGHTGGIFSESLNPRRPERFGSKNPMVLIGNTWMKFSHIVDGWTRYADYKAAIEKGESREEAAKTSRWVGADFYTRGQLPKVESVIAAYQFLGAIRAGIDASRMGLIAEMKHNPAAVKRRWQKLGIFSSALFVNGYRNAGIEEAADLAIYQEAGYVNIPVKTDIYDEYVREHGEPPDAATSRDIGAIMLVSVPTAHEVGALAKLFETMGGAARRMAEDGDPNMKRFADSTGALFSRNLPNVLSPAGVGPLFWAGIGTNPFTGNTITPARQKGLRPSDMKTGSPSIDALSSMFGANPHSVKHVATGWLGMIGADAIRAADFMYPSERMAGREGSFNPLSANRGSRAVHEIHDRLRKGRELLNAERVYIQRGDTEAIEKWGKQLNENIVDQNNYALALNEASPEGSFLSNLHAQRTAAREATDEVIRDMADSLGIEGAYEKKVADLRRMVYEAYDIELQRHSNEMEKLFYNLEKEE